MLTVPAIAGTEPFDRLLLGLRSEKVDRRRAALEQLIADPSVVPEDRRERVIRHLATMLDKDRRPELRGLAARALAHYRSTENDFRILRRLGEERAWRGQRPMMTALTGHGDETTSAWLQKRVFKEPRDGVRALWVEALGRSVWPEDYSTLQKIAGIRTPWPVAQAAAIALGRHRKKTSVDRLIDLLWGDRDGVRAAAYESLVRLTGKSEL